MAVIHRHLATTAVPCTAPRQGMLIQGGITATYAHLIDLFGAPDLSSARPGSIAASDSTLWAIATSAGRAHLSTWADVAHLRARPAADHRWTIQATDASALPWIHKVTHGSTAGFPGAGHPDAHPTRAELTAAYLHYLLDRMISQDERAHHYPPRSDQHRHLCDQVRHIESLLPPMRRILNEHRWAPTITRRSAAAEPVASAGTDCGPPTQFDREPRVGDAARWADGRSRPGGRDEDVAQALNALATQQAATHHRTVPTGHPGDLPETRAAFAAEHVATLRALADTVLPAPPRRGPIRTERVGEGRR